MSTSQGLISAQKQSEMDRLNEELKKARYIAGFHGDTLIGNKQVTRVGALDDIHRVVTLKNTPEIIKVLKKLMAGGGIDLKAGARLFGSMSNDSTFREKYIEKQVKAKYDRMLHPPVTYLGGAFKYRTADGKFNSALHPHLGQAGAPYAKTVPAVTAPLGALPDPGDIFDRLMARDPKGRPSKSGLSSMLIYHATIIIHDIFRTNDKDKNISDSSSYLDLSPLYGFTEEMQRKVRDGKYKLGLLKPDTFAEDRLLRQPPGVCIMLVMYNRYHNYAATQLRRINENGRFSIPSKFRGAKPLAAAEALLDPEVKKSDAYKAAVKAFNAANDVYEKHGRPDKDEHWPKASADLKAFIRQTTSEKAIDDFYTQYDAAWDKLDDDLFNTARLITCGMYIQISIHDYLRALMGFHQFDSNFTLDPRLHETTAKDTSRGLGNQVTVEFNCLYRFHCAISAKDEAYSEKYMREMFAKDENWDPKKMSLDEFISLMTEAKVKANIKANKIPKEEKERMADPSNLTFGLEHGDEHFGRDPFTGLFNDKQMVDALLAAMDDPISNFGPRNVPRCLKPVEIMGILQARKWEIGTLNDFREFFGMSRHQTFESISDNVEVQNALRDLYEHPDKVELYPGVFCESDSTMNCDPGPSDVNSALWAAIFSDAITLVRSDRFYTVDWNTNSLTSWGMKEVMPDNEVLKTSVFHRLLQRAFPEWFPSDSIRFFHPFYTGQTNATYAREQGYEKNFKIEPVSLAARNWLGRKKNPDEQDVFDISESEPRKPAKPEYLTDTSVIRAVLEDKSDVIVHPARLYLSDLPEDIQEILKPHQKHRSTKEGFEEDPAALSGYFVGLMQDIIKREYITIDPDRKPSPVYQIDIARDFAIPVITRCVADFLGFGHLLKSSTNQSGRYSENEIYQHITHCQVYLSYNADETKTLKRRKQFQESMRFLFDLTRDGSVATANQFVPFRKLGELFSGQRNPMEELGFQIAQEILKNEGHRPGRAAAILLLVGLDNAYNTVLAFNSVLNKFISDLYDKAADRKPKAPASNGSGGAHCDWLEIQELAFKEASSAQEQKAIHDRIQRLVLLAQHETVKLPIIRKVVEDHDVVDPLNVKNVLLSVTKGQTIVCDYNPKVHPLSSSAVGINGAQTGYPEDWELAFFARHSSSFTNAFAQYHPKRLAILSLTRMIAVLATLKNLRRGHDTQGRLKRVRIENSAEGYANYMAPLRVNAIAAGVHEAIVKIKNNDSLSEAQKEQKIAEAKAVYDGNSILKPETATYLTPEWDEMVPFPTTWKLRFDGFGWSDYGDRVSLSGLKATEKVKDDFAPFYEAPGGESRVGGSFADSSCVCRRAGVACTCKKEEGAKKKDDLEVSCRVGH